MPGGTSVEVRLPILALIHEATLPGGSPLPPGTTEVDLRADPLAPAVSAALAALLTDRLRLASGDEALPLTVTSVAPAGDDVAITATSPPVTGALGVSADLFPADTLHKVFVDVYRGEALAGQWALDARAASFSLDAAQRPLAEVVATFVREGIHHIFIGPDHILFVLALILLVGTLLAQVKIITAFTVAHSITLTLATLGWVELPSRLVESAIALSVVVVGLHDLWRLRSGVAAPSGARPAPRLRLRLRPGAWLRLRERAGRARPSPRGAGLVPGRLQPRRRDRPSPDRAGGGAARAAAAPAGPTGRRAGRPHGGGGRRGPDGRDVVLAAGAGGLSRRRRKARLTRLDAALP